MTHQNEVARAADELQLATTSNDNDLLLLSSVSIFSLFPSMPAIPPNDANILAGSNENDVAAIHQCNHGPIKFKMKGL